MVKIRYAELPAGLHVVTEGRDGCTTVFLLPGLTPPQRRAALTFARRSARIGHGPSLPAIDMAFALAADRARTSGRTAIAVLRRHPMLLLPMVAVVSGVIVVTMLSVVTVGPTTFRFPGTDPALHGTGGQPAKSGHQASGGPPAASPGQTSPGQTSPQQTSPQQTSPQQTSRPRSSRQQNSQQQNSQQDPRDATTPTPASASMSILPPEVGFISAHRSVSQTPSAGDAPAAKVTRPLCIAVGSATFCLRL